MVFKFTHGVIALDRIIFDRVVENVPLVLADLALDREVADCDQLAVIQLLVHCVCALVVLHCVSEDNYDEESNNGDAEAHEVFEFEHFRILLAGHL